MLNVNVSGFDALSKKIIKLENQVKTHKQEVVMPHYFQKMQVIVSNAAWMGRQQIKDATTATGNARAARGNGSAGRIVTRRFIEGIKHRGRKVGNNYEFEIGWLEGLPEYASYQELGFKHRSGVYVTGADALGAINRYIKLETEKLK